MPKWTQSRLNSGLESSRQDQYMKTSLQRLISGLKMSGRSGHQNLAMRRVSCWLMVSFSLCPIWLRAGRVRDAVRQFNIKMLNISCNQLFIFLEAGADHIITDLSFELSCHYRSISCHCLNGLADSLELSCKSVLLITRLPLALNLVCHPFCS